MGQSSVFLYGVCCCLCYIPNHLKFLFCFPAFHCKPEPSGGEPHNYSALWVLSLPAQLLICMQLPLTRSTPNPPHPHPLIKPRALLQTFIDKWFIFFRTTLVAWDKFSLHIMTSSLELCRCMTKERGFQWILHHKQQQHSGTHWQKWGDETWFPTAAPPILLADG